MNNKLGQIKSEERVREHGEVFTNPREVKAMLDLIPNITIDMTFLEPTCGNGNFVVEIIKRKFDLCKKHDDFIVALTSVYAIDIMADNIQECKNRVLELYKTIVPKKVQNHCPEKGIKLVECILDTHIFQGNSLAIMQLLDDKIERINVISKFL